MMLITAFRGQLGHSILITGRDNVDMLIDGGTAAEYRAHIAPLLARVRRNGRKLRCICLTAPVLGRIDGIVQLFEDAVHHRIAAYQHNTGNREFRKTAAPQPPAVGAVWFNSVHELAGITAAGLAEQLEAQATWIALVKAQAPAAPKSVLAAIQQSERLAALLSPRELGIPRNPEVDGRPLRQQDRANGIRLGALTVDVIGPLPHDLESCGGDWTRWLRETNEAHARLMERAGLQAVVRAAIAASDRHESIFALAAALRPAAAAGIPDLPSIILLIREKQASMLIPGTASVDTILLGLARSGRLDSDGAAHFNVLQLPVSASARTATEDFFRRITADHYLLATGSVNRRPSVEMIEGLFSARLADARARKPFTVWVNDDATSIESASNADVQRFWDHVASRIKLSRGTARCKFLPRRADALRLEVRAKG